MSRSVPPLPDPPGIRARYRLVWRRRRALWRAFRARHALTAEADRTGAIVDGDVLVILVVRNEALRLPWFLHHYRAMGAGHFLVVDNASTDGTRALLADQADVSLWSTAADYRGARFGLDWAGWLMMRHGHGRWCLMVDADELMVYDGWPDRGLPDLTRWLDARGQAAFGALMLDLYPEGPVGAGAPPEGDPIRALPWFDAGPYRAVRQAPMQNLWVQGGARERAFFAGDPERSPTLNKLPLIRWHRRWAFQNSCHSVLPWRLNLAYSGPGGDAPSGVLLHTKFLPDVIGKSAEDVARRQHFHDPDRLRGYYDRIAEKPVLWHEGSTRYEGPDQLVRLGLMGAIDW